MCNWRPIDTAPFGRDLQLSVVEQGTHALVFPSRRTAAGWMTRTGTRIDVNPSHWRDWEDFEQPCDCHRVSELTSESAARGVSR